MSQNPALHRQLHRSIYLYDLLYELVIRDIKLRYKRSILGILWSLLNPLAQLLVLTFVFHFVLPLGIPNYTLFLFTGLLAWNWFQSSLTMATGSIVDNRELIRRPGFPVAVLPLVIVLSNMIHFLLALPILFAFLWFEALPVTSALLALPLVIAFQFLFTVSLSYFLATFHVTFRDTQYLVGILLLLGFYLSPIFYSVDSLPLRYQLIYSLNPVVHLLNAYRTIFIQGALPNALPLLLFSLLSIALLLLGYRVFVQASYRFGEEL